MVLVLLWNYINKIIERDSGNNLNIVVCFNFLGFSKSTRLLLFGKTLGSVI